MSLRELAAAMASALGDSLLALLAFLEGLAKIVVGRALALVLAVSVVLVWLLAFQHADDFSRPLLIQTRDTVMALLRAKQAEAEARAVPYHSGLKTPPEGP